MNPIPKEDRIYYSQFMRMFKTSTESARHFREVTLLTNKPNGDPITIQQFQRTRPRGYQYQKKIFANDCLHLIEFNLYKDTELNAFVIVPGYIQHVKHPQVWIETTKTYDKLTSMYARFLVKDVVTFGRKWFCQHLNNIISPEHIQLASSWFNNYYPIQTQKIDYSILEDKEFLDK